MKENIVLYALIALVIFFAGGSVVLHVTAPDDCNPRCGPVFEVHYSDTFYFLSPDGIPGYHAETEVNYNDGEWELHMKPKGYDSSFAVSTHFPPGFDLPVYTPDVEVKDGKLYFDILLFNNVGYDLVNVTFETVSDIQIKKNADGAYGEYSRYDPKSGIDRIYVGDLSNESFKEVRLSAPLIPAESPESFFVKVNIVLPDSLETKDGSELKYDINEYLLPEMIPDVYTVDSYDSSPVYEVFRFFIV
ncbi:hypothetical protein [Methanoplanus endosymbiosus]|uniref:Uncharacterized protein n=1 Tax=Methanoplanus endosymbiosus TaxID=33865 RepID=A0A9E7THN8_9EURY|nr:hypothetical protein [Methanoplanus endosymbiosus]UUX93297.1 hypothetical protein L6E24_04005 [Methanoplanus endosymbiosus]